jgi:hypothetical protein
MGINFSAIERKLDPTCATPRQHGAGSVQPNLWRRYGLGEVSPSDRVIELADAFAPAARRVFDSILWEVLRSRGADPHQCRKWMAHLEPETLQRWKAHCKLGQDSWVSLLTANDFDMKEFAKFFSFDVLALLLLYLKYTELGKYAFETVFIIREWLTTMIRKSETYHNVKDLLFAAVEEYAPELGPLRGERGLSVDKSSEQQRYDARRSRPSQDAVTLVLGVPLARKDWPATVQVESSARKSKS